MDIKIDNSNPFQAMFGAGKFCRNRNTVENAKPHWFCRLRMMTRRANGAEGIAGITRTDFVDSLTNRPDRAISGFPGRHRHHCVPIKRYLPLRRCDFVDPVLSCWWTEASKKCNRASPECAGRDVYTFTRDGSTTTGVNQWSYGDTSNWEQTLKMVFVSPSIPRQFDALFSNDAEFVDKP